MSVNSKTRARYLGRHVPRCLPGRAKIITHLHYRSQVLTDKRRQNRDNANDLARLAAVDG